MCIHNGDVTLIKTSRDWQMFAAVSHHAEGLRHVTLLTLQEEKSLICLGGTRRPTIPIIEQDSILFLETLTDSTV
jgi:hypothetical protein